MVPFVSLVLGLVFGVILLWPPLAFVRSLARYTRVKRTDLGFFTRTLWLVVGLVPFVFNASYMYLSWPSIVAAKLVPDTQMAVAAVVAWLCFWGHIALKRRGLRRRRRT